MSVNICRVCRQDITDCKEDDKRHIAPYDPRNEFKLQVNVEDRADIVLLYILGCYRSDINQFYIPGNHLSRRKILDTYTNLPICVINDDWEYAFKQREKVIRININTLPLSKYHIYLLHKYIFGNYYDD